MEQLVIFEREPGAYAWRIVMPSGAIIDESVLTYVSEAEAQIVGQIALEGA